MNQDSWQEHGICMASAVVDTVDYHLKRFIKHWSINSILKGNTCLLNKENVFVKISAGKK